MRMLLCCDGSPHTNTGVEYGARLARAVATSVDILAVAAQASDEPVRRIVAKAQADLHKAGIPITTHWAQGTLAEQVVQHTRSNRYDFVVIGSRGRRGFLRMVLGSVALYVSGRAPASVLVVKGRARDPSRLLICTAAGPWSDEIAAFSVRFAQALGASVKLLHVMSQLPLTYATPASDLEATAGELIECGAREGIHLARMLEMLSTGTQTAHAVVRHGLVLDEIVAEVKEGGYDMLIIGAHVTPGVSPRLLDNLSADILLSVDCPVMIVAHRQHPARDETS
jgi:nucleotide-binding universal stress UspA family protein